MPGIGEARAKERPPTHCAAVRANGAGARPTHREEWLPVPTGAGREFDWSCRQAEQRPHGEQQGVAELADETRLAQLHERVEHQREEHGVRAGPSTPRGAVACLAYHRAEPTGVIFNYCNELTNPYTRK